MAVEQQFADIHGHEDHRVDHREHGAEDEGGSNVARDARRESKQDEERCRRDPMEHCDVLVVVVHEVVVPLDPPGAAPAYERVGQVDSGQWRGDTQLIQVRGERALGFVDDYWESNEGRFRGSARSVLVQTDWRPRDGRLLGFDLTWTRPLLGRVIIGFQWLDLVACSHVI